MIIITIEKNFVSCKIVLTFEEGGFNILQHFGSNSYNTHYYPYTLANNVFKNKNSFIFADPEVNNWIKSSYHSFIKNKVFL